MLFPFPVFGIVKDIKVDDFLFLIMNFGNLQVA